MSACSRRAFHVWFPTSRHYLINNNTTFEIEIPISETKPGYQRWPRPRGQHNCIKSHNISLDKQQDSHHLRRVTMECLYKLYTNITSYSDHSDTFLYYYCGQILSCMPVLLNIDIHGFSVVFVHPVFSSAATPVPAVSTARRPLQQVSTGRTPFLWVNHQC